MMMTRVKRSMPVSQGDVGAVAVAFAEEAPSGCGARGSRWRDGAGESVGKDGSVALLRTMFLVLGGMMSEGWKRMFLACCGRSRRWYGISAA